MFCVQTLFCKVHCVTVHHVNVQQQVRQPERILCLASWSLMQIELYTPTVCLVLTGAVQNQDMFSFYAYFSNTPFKETEVEPFPSQTRT